MDNVKNDAYYIKRLRQDLEFVVTHMKNDDIVIYSSVLTQIYYQYINKYLKELSNTSSLSRINFNGD